MSVLAWHFLQKGGKLRRGCYNETPLTPPPDGKWLVYPKEYQIRICSTGLHASKRLWEAASYGNSPNLCRVECDEIIEDAYDKFVCAKRRILWRVDPRDAIDVAVRQRVLDTHQAFGVDEEQFLVSGETRKNSTRFTERTYWWQSSKEAYVCTHKCDEGSSGFLRFACRVLSDSEVEQVIREEARRQYKKRGKKNRWLERGM